MVNRNMLEGFNIERDLSGFVKSYIANALLVAKFKFPTAQWNYVTNNLSSGPQIGLDHVKFLGEEILHDILEGENPPLVETVFGKIKLSRDYEDKRTSELGLEVERLTDLTLKKRKRKLKDAIKYLKGEKYSFIKNK